MITYEITAVVGDAFVAAYEKYMTDQHISDVLATGCFLSAALYRDGNNFRIRYDAADQNALDKYLDEHTERLRADFHMNFPAGVEQSRQVWEVIARFEAP